MKKIFVGIIIGSILTISTTAFADTGLKEISAFLNPSLPIKLDGKQISLQNPPITYDGTTYVALREVGSLVGKPVKWNDTEKSVEIGNSINRIDDHIVNVDGSDYIDLHFISQIYGSKRISYLWDDVKKEYTMVKQDSTGDSSKDVTLFEHIPAKVFDGASYISYQLYMEKLLPILTNVKQ
ncbi:stalk domain-containing protein [Paenibacillus cremeus]|nr:stalk domain-containing protein [Paenibacillus cremeus]